MSCVRAVCGACAVVVALASAMAQAQSVPPEVPVVRASATDRKEAARRLAQAQRELARGPDMQQGIPPSAEKSPGDRRRARVNFLQRNVEAARIRAREVNAAGAPFPPKDGV